MAPTEGALTIDVVLDELQRLVAAAVAEEDSGAASYEAVQGRVVDLSLHALTYIRFLENHGYITYDRSADKISVSESGRAAVTDPTLWHQEASTSFAERLHESQDDSGLEEIASEVDDLLASMGDLDVVGALDEASAAADLSMQNVTSGRLGGSGNPPSDSTQPTLATPAIPAAPNGHNSAPANAGNDMAQQDISSRRVGAQATAPASSSPSAASGLYERNEAIGSGGMGTVYRARQVKLDRPVALKEIKEIFDVFAGVQRSDIVEKFTRIVQTQARLLHPNIIQVIDLDTDAQFPFVVMQYAPNGNLRRLINTPSRPPLQIALKYFLQILHALNTAHDNGVTHGGIKPENIVLDHAGNALVSDFGISGVAELDANRGASQVYVGVGTVAYMSPEQFRDPNSSSVKSDIYSLGIMFYEMLTGKVPGRRSPMPSSFFPDIPRALDDIFDRMSMDDGDERYSSIEEILADIYAADDVMAILDKRGGFLFLRDPMTHGAAGIASGDEGDESEDDFELPSGGAAALIGDEYSEPQADGADLDLGVPEGDDADVLGKLDKYGELFDEEESDADDEADSEADDDV